MPIPWALPLLGAGSTADVGRPMRLDLTAWNDARVLKVTIQNLLLVSTGASPSLALVEKKFVGLTPDMLAGLGLVGWMVRRRRCAS